jgi:hypothetical protein
MVSAVTGIEAGAFNAPKIGQLRTALLAQPGAPGEIDQSKIKLYWASTDIVHRIGGEQIGTAVGEFQIEPPSFRHQLSALVTGAILGTPSPAAFAILSWLGFRTVDQHDMEKLFSLSRRNTGV